MMIIACCSKGSSRLIRWYHYHAATLLFLFATISKSDKYHDCSTPTLHHCGDKYYNISYPFGCQGRPDYCSHPGYYLDCEHDYTKLMINVGDRIYQVMNIDYDKDVLTVVDSMFIEQHPCTQSFSNFTLNFQPFNSTGNVNILIFNCDDKDAPEPPLKRITCPTALSHFFYSLESEVMNRSVPCTRVALVPIREAIATSLESDDDFWTLGKGGFSLNWSEGKGWCSDCLQSGGACGYDEYNRTSIDHHVCYHPDPEKSNKTWKVVGGCVGGVGVISLAFALCFWYKTNKRKQRSVSANLLIRSMSSELSSTMDPELGSVNYRTHIFSYEELHLATNGFNEELGDGGFGTVYKGQLRDGRIVAVKRLYENNCKRVEQFMNEVDILSRLRHKYLVTLYGCTTRHSRELLLVYEFISNGTVADHLHGPRASDGGLTWPVRLNIAIETADALAYLHAVEPQIIHRDVKTNNILLDNNFHVKVADFGLSRLFPMDASHVSTLPQGTPGYVDPEYHQCYQLTDKSDVYSFGVVLVELISSKPAVDISRHRHEINLASMAINKIQNRELEQLFDPHLGYQTEGGIEKMLTMVAELAFRCLQGESEMRPSIKEVLAELMVIQNVIAGAEKTVEANTQVKEESCLLKNGTPFSPDTVTAKWDSILSTPNASG